MADGARRAGVGRRVAAGALAVAFLLSFVVFLSASAAVRGARKGSAGYLLASLGAPADPARAVRAPDAALLRRALRNDPLNPAVVNAAIYAEATIGRSAAAEARRLAVLGELGWRHTPALQNLIYEAARTADLRRAADLTDALLRRQSIVDQATAVMNLIELDPSTRGIVVGKLAANPRWRRSYLQTVDQLRSRPQIVARGDLALRLQRTAAPLVRDEVSPIALQLLNADEDAAAYALWRSYRRVAGEPLNDPTFTWLRKRQSDDVVAMPFEWILRSGDGYWSEVPNAAPAEVLIHWDRRGVPDLLLQRTFLKPGSYRLRIEGRDATRKTLDLLSFTLRCENGPPVRFERIVRQGRGTLIVAADSLVGCASPTFFVSGRPRESEAMTLERMVAGGETYDIALSGLRLIPVSAG